MIPMLRPVDRVGLAAHVGLPGVGAGLAAAAGVLLAAEGAADLGAAGADVHVGDAAVAAAWERKRSASQQVVGEDRLDRPCGTSLCRRDRLVEVSYFDHVEDRREGLVLHDRHVCCRAFDDRGLDEAAAGACRRSSTSPPQRISPPCSFAARARPHVVHRALVDQRTHQRASSSGIADGDRSRRPSPGGR
jgi:hypothetical protein